MSIDEEHKLAELLQEATDYVDRDQPDDAFPQWDLTEMAELLATQHTANLITAFRQELSTGCPTKASSRDCQATTADCPRFPCRMGKYALLELLGTGGFAHVYLARDEELDRYVALKIPHRRIYDSQAAQSRFLREARAAARLDHPQIVALYEVGLYQQTPYIAFAYCPGETLAEWLKAHRSTKTVRHPRSATRQIAQWMYQLADAVAHAHGKNVLHRDLKPGNILLQGDDALEIRVSDFGMAKHLYEEEGPEVTREGDLVGTPAYMSPEQSRGQTLGPASDVFSVGAILFELLTGQAPFQRPTTAETFAALQGDDVPRRKLQGADRDLSAICLKCLEKDPEQRYASAHELREDLSAWLAGNPVTARHATVSERLLKWSVSNPAVVSALSFAFLVLLLASFTFRGLWLTAEQQRISAERQRQVASLHERKAQSAWRQAEKEKEAAQRTLQVFLAAIDQANPKRKGHRDMTAYDFLNATHQLVESTLHDDPTARAPILKSLGRAYASIGFHEQAADCQRSAVAIFSRELGEGASDTLSARRDLARSLRELGDYAEAIEHQQIAIKSDPNRSSRRLQWSRHQLAETYLELGDVDRALALLNGNIDFAEPLGGEEDIPSSDSLLLPARLTLIQILYNRGEAERALQTARQEWQERSERYGVDDIRTLRAKSLLARCKWWVGNQKKAISTQANTCQLAANRYPDSVFQLREQTRLANWLSVDGQNESALALFQQVVDKTTDRFGLSHPESLNVSRFYGVALHRAGRQERAINVLESAYQACVDRFGSPRKSRAVDLALELATCRRANGENQRALELLLVSLGDENVPPNPGREKEEMQLMIEIINCLNAVDDLPRAVDFLKSRLKTYRTDRGTENSMVRTLAGMLALLHIRQNQPDQALALLVSDFYHGAKPDSQDDAEIAAIVFLASRLEESDGALDLMSGQLSQKERIDLGRELMLHSYVRQIWRNVIPTLEPQSIWRRDPARAHEVALISSGRLAALKKQELNLWDRIIVESSHDLFQSELAEQTASAHVANQSSRRLPSTDLSPMPVQ